MTAVLPAPTLAREHAMLAQGHHLVAGVDEVGRGALAGPVCVGVVVVSALTGPPPDGLADSKLLGPADRLALRPKLTRWAQSHELGWASPQEIDQFGLTEALRLAGHRALAGLAAPPDGIVLDGKHDWLTQLPTLFAPQITSRWVVQTLVKADQSCAAVAAASVLAKVARDQVMVELDEQFPGYGWAGNKGYGSPGHLEALRQLGPSRQHRQSWALPTRGSGEA
ncbi:MAG: ribonuclease HII [Bifidobacteriaceae bacterium]|jgi:ribonuclease HII|nr:ribonuclease HII [Bifidobacteriaceae bacterium]